MGAQSMKQEERVCAHSVWMTGTVPKVSPRLKWIQGRTVEKMTAITQGPPRGVAWRPGTKRSREKRGALHSVTSRVRPSDGTLPSSSVHGFPGKSTGVGCHFLLQEIFLTQGLNLGLPHCRQMLYHLSHQGSPLIKGNAKSSHL